MTSRLRALIRIVFIGETSLQVRNEQSMHDSFVFAHGIYVADSIALDERRQFDPRMTQIMVDIRPSSIGEQFKNVDPHVGYRALLWNFYFVWSNRMAPSSVATKRVLAILGF